MVDIVITYLNERDSKWQEDYNYWRIREINQGRNRASNRQAFGKERAREWDTLKYWFRGVEKNCSWINKIFLVVQNERHVPDWLKKDHPKLRVVYHNEYIPKELLPTFNAMTIGMYVSNIPDLSENYIMCDDDFYFLNEIKEDRFFKNGKPVHLDNRVPYGLYGGNALKGTDKVFYHILNNNIKFVRTFTGKQIRYGFYHLPEARLKSFEQLVLKKCKDEIYYHNSFSKFRHKTNLCPYMFDDLLKACGKAVLGNPYENCGYRALKSDINFADYKNKDIMCFNDTEQLDDYDKTKDKLIKFFDEMFPEKSTFEV